MRIAALFCLLGACQSSSPPYVQLDPGERENVASKGVWVLAATPKPEIIFTESVSKFLWWNHVAALHTYGGLWDPWPAVEAIAAKELTRRFQFDAVALPIEPTERDELLASLSAAYRDAVEKGSDEFFKWLVGPAPAQGELLRARGGSYLLELWCEPVVGRDSWKGAWVSVYSTCRLIRADGAVVWAGSGFADHGLEDFEDYRKLVERDFHLLQLGLDQAIAEMVSWRSGLSPFGSFLPPAEDR